MNGNNNFQALQQASCVQYAGGLLARMGVEFGGDRMAGREFNVAMDYGKSQTFFAKLAGNLQNQEPFRKAVAKLIQGYMERSFAGEQTPMGAPWADLKPTTIAQRKRQGLVPIIKLQATKKGKKSIKFVPTATGFIVEAVDYMDYHNTGTSKMPARRWLMSGKEMTTGEPADGIKAIAEAQLTQGLGSFVQGEISRTPAFVKNLLGL